MTRPTPETDALCRARLYVLHARTADGQLPPVPEDPYAQIIIDHARSLERRLAAAVEDLESLRAKQKSAAAPYSMGLIARLSEWAQNQEMVDQHFTAHGRDCIDAANMLERAERERDALNEINAGTPK